MTTYTDTNALAPRFSDGKGNAYCDDGSAATPSTFTTTDKARLVRIPAGTRVTEIAIRNTDLDTATTITANFGYEAATSGSSLTASTTYFGSALTILQSAGRSVLAFDPITFDEDVWLTCIPQAGPATTAGTIKAIVLGKVVGVK
jgi:hypothetical protein